MKTEQKAVNSNHPTTKEGQMRIAFKEKLSKEQKKISPDYKSIRIYEVQQIAFFLSDDNDKIGVSLCFDEVAPLKRGYREAEKEHKDYYDLSFEFKSLGRWSSNKKKVEEIYKTICEKGFYDFGSVDVTREEDTISEDGAGKRSDKVVFA